MGTPSLLYSPEQEICLISLYQPWASFIPYSVKVYETRSWYTAYHGWVAVHAGKRQLNRAGANTALRVHYLYSEAPKPRLVHPDPSYPTGCVVAVAWLDDCQVMTHREGVVAAVLWGMVWAKLSGEQALPRWVMVVLAVSLTSCAVDISRQSELERATGDWRMSRFAWRLKYVQPLSQPVETKGYQGLRRIEALGLRQAIAEAVDS